MRRCFCRRMCRTLCRKAMSRGLSLNWCGRASILNKNQRRTAHGQIWTPIRVCSARNHHGIPVYSEGERQARGEMSVREVADVLGVTPTTIFRLIQLNQLPATQACVNAPWVMLKSDVELYGAERNQSNTPPPRDSAPLLFEIKRHTKQCTMSYSRRTVRLASGSCRER